MGILKGKDKMKKIAWYIYGIDYVLRNRCKKIYKIPYSSRKVYTAENASKIMYDKLLSNEPFFAGRIGLFELAAMRAYEFHNTDKYSIVMKQIYDCAGFFPLDLEMGEQFLKVCVDSLKQVDILACSGQLDENYFMNHYTPCDAIAASNFDVMEPWRFELPWSAALKGKKVLVVSPFEDSIREQYMIHDKIFKGTDILPDFELLTYKSLQTTGDIVDERFATWFEALDYMFEEISNIEFDVALLGCGAYGFPLAAKIKKSGKQAIHMGGILQILFGIMGKRWDGTAPGYHAMREDIAPYYNSNWTYPKQSETPVSASKVEYGPYWR